MRELLVKMKVYCCASGVEPCVSLVGMDDKAKIAIGHPGLPLSASPKAHAKCIVPVASTAAQATDKTSSSIHALGVVKKTGVDHDFNGHMNLTPGAILLQDIPPVLGHSWYRGQGLVSMTNSVFDVSNPWKHMAVLGQVWLDNSGTFAYV